VTNTLSKFLLTTIPVNKLINIPNVNVMAKPLTGPEECRKEKSNGLASINAVINVAIFASHPFRSPSKTDLSSNSSLD